MIYFAVPESTVRGLRTQYLSKKNHRKNFDEIPELNYGRRGRPMRLGKYDSVVQKCILELVASGEKPTSFMAVGMISHKKSQITFFGHKHKIKILIKKFDIFHKKFQQTSIWFIFGIKLRIMNQNCIKND